VIGKAKSHHGDTEELPKLPRLPKIAESEKPLKRGGTGDAEGLA
jgi:hypothetical protein